ncbi:hypothetical protein UO65_0207 [Actinokineospora spheciospongiae]|uniref:Uncharacterized protein n=1 Tax=Actinokineospora spheciospongiae TaxID=909613 RepID=W7IUK8_9PSEU|nr:hypothetical protein UO65_0207 [Actinokineospora spheciospongiae]
MADKIATVAHDSPLTPCGSVLAPLSTAVLKITLGQSLSGAITPPWPL